MGTIGIAAWVALLAFPALLVIGWTREEIGLRGTAVFFVLGLAAWLGLPQLVPSGENYVTSALAVLDIALVLAVFKGDARIGQG